MRLVWSSSRSKASLRYRASARLVEAAARPASITETGLVIRPNLRNHADLSASVGDATDWLRSDWRPVGSPLTNAQAARRNAMFTAIKTAKAAINQVKA
jgi:hypothetical protein